METIVVGYDATPEAERALERAAILAAALPARIVVATIDTLTRGKPWHDDAERLLAEEAAERLRDRGLETSARLGTGEPAEAIARIAREEAAGLVVVGARDRSWLDRLIEGSVSDGVAHRVRADVLIVHSLPPTQ